MCFGVTMRVVKQSGQGLLAGLLLGVLVLAVSPVRAIRYLSDTEAYSYVLGEGVDLTPQIRTLTADQAKELTAYSGIPSAEGDSVEFQIGRRAGELVGYALMLTEKTRYRPITFAVSVGPDGRVMKSVVVVYREPRGEQVKSERFNSQFEGKTRKDPLQVGASIRAVSGATVSAEVMTMGVKKALYLVSEFFLKQVDASGRPS